MRNIEDEADARRCLGAVKAGGGDLVQWARAHSVDARSLNAWRVNLGRRRKPRLVELVPASVPRATARYVLVVGDARVEFDDACSAATLERVLHVLQAARGC